MTFEELIDYNKNTPTAKEVAISSLNFIDNTCSYKTNVNELNFFQKNNFLCSIEEFIEKIKNNEIFVLNLSILNCYLNS